MISNDIAIQELYIVARHYFLGFKLINTDPTAITILKGLIG